MPALECENVSEYNKRAVFILPSSYSYKKNVFPERSHLREICSSPRCLRMTNLKNNKHVWEKHPPRCFLTNTPPPPTHTGPLIVVKWLLMVIQNLLCMCVHSLTLRHLINTNGPTGVCFPPSEPLIWWEHAGVVHEAPTGSLNNADPFTPTAAQLHHGICLIHPEAGPLSDRQILNKPCLEFQLVKAHGILPPIIRS